MLPNSPRLGLQQHALRRSSIHTLLSPRLPGPALSPRTLQVASGREPRTGDIDATPTEQQATNKAPSLTELKQRASKAAVVPPSSFHGVRKQSTTETSQPQPNAVDAKPQGPHSVLRLPTYSQAQIAPGPFAPPPPAELPAQLYVPLYTTTPLPLCSVSDVQAFLRSLEVPEYALRALKDHGVTGVDLLDLRIGELTDDGRFRLPRVVARKIVRGALSWRLLCMLAGSDVRVVLERETAIDTCIRAGLAPPGTVGTSSRDEEDHDQQYDSTTSSTTSRGGARSGGGGSGQEKQGGGRGAGKRGGSSGDGGGGGGGGGSTRSAHGMAPGVPRIEVLLSALDSDKDGTVTLEELARGAPFLAMVLLEELEHWSIEQVPDPALRARLIKLLHQVMDLEGGAGRGGDAGGRWGLVDDTPQDPPPSPPSRSSPSRAGGGWLNGGSAGRALRSGTPTCAEHPQAQQPYTLAGCGEATPIATHTMGDDSVGWQAGCASAHASADAEGCGQQQPSAAAAVLDVGRGASECMQAAAAGAVAECATGVQCEQLDGLGPMRVPMSRSSFPMESVTGGDCSRPSLRSSSHSFCAPSRGTDECDAACEAETPCALPCALPCAPDASNDGFGQGGSSSTGGGGSTAAWDTGAARTRLPSGPEVQGLAGSSLHPRPCSASCPSAASSSSSSSSPIPSSPWAMSGAHGHHTHAAPRRSGSGSGASSGRGRSGPGPFASHCAGPSGTSARSVTAAAAVTTGWWPGPMGQRSSSPGWGRAGAPNVGMSSMASWAEDGCDVNLPPCSINVPVDQPSAVPAAAAAAAATAAHAVRAHGPPAAGSLPHGHKVQRMPPGDAALVATSTAATMLSLCFSIAHMVSNTAAHL